MVNIDNVLAKMSLYSEYIDYIEFENAHDGTCYCTVTFVHLNHYMSPETSKLIHVINQFIIDFDGILSRETTACTFRIRFEVHFK